MATLKSPLRRPSQLSDSLKDYTENTDPNLHIPIPSGKPTKSPAVKKAEPRKSIPKSPPHIIFDAGDRKSTSAKKKSCKGRASAKNPHLPVGVEYCIEKDKEKDQMRRSTEEDLERSLEVRKMRNLMLEEAMSSIPEPGYGRVMHLVKAFERLLSLSIENEGKPDDEESTNRVKTWALPGLRQPPKAKATEDSPPFVFHGDFSNHSLVDSNSDRLSSESSTSDRGRNSRRNSTDTSERSWIKKLKVTSQQPFKLRTEQRGKLKEDFFFKKVKEMLLQEERQRIQTAQGLPWTTDHPELLRKPRVKEPTEPIEVVLHSDIRAVERAEFDDRVAERMSLIELMKLEREKLRKLEEEEEIRRLRREELVSRAQPMPYFDRPFVPKRSSKPRTVPKEPKLCTTQRKKQRVVKRGNKIVEV